MEEVRRIVLWQEGKILADIRKADKATLYGKGNKIIVNVTIQPWFLPVLINAVGGLIASFKWLVYKR